MTDLDKGKYALVFGERKTKKTKLTTTSTKHTHKTPTNLQKLSEPAYSGKAYLGFATVLYQYQA